MARFGGAYRRTAEVFFALLSVSLLVLAGYVWLTYRNINDGVTRLPVSVGVHPTDKPDVDIDRSDQNLLVVGIDDRSNMTDAEVKMLKVGRDGGSLNTDTMMIVHIPADGSKATLISLPRDSYVQIPGHGWNRLNSAYADGYLAASGSTNHKRTEGADLLLQTVTNLTGLTIDHYVQVSFMGFYDLANAIGGITVNLCDSVDDTVAYNRSQGVTGGSGFKMSKGVHHLNPVQSLEFVRQRHNFPDGLGDLDRVRREQYFLTAAFRKVASLDMLFKLASLGDALKRNVYMDSGLNLLDLARQMESLSANNIAGDTIPNTPATIDGNDVLQVRPAQVQKFVDNVINPPAHSARHHAHKHKPIDAKCIS